jgi:FMN-dependent NADH-azoreductase
MKTLLQLNSSIFSTAGQSSQLADTFVSAWRASHGNGKVVLRDLAREPLPHLDGERFQAFLARPEDRTPAQKAAAELSDALIDEIKRADVVVIGLPMYNFGVPSTLKAYFDHIARAGLTFRYTDKGAEGLLRDKKAYVFATRGGKYLGTPVEHQAVFIKQFLNFVGIDEIEFIYAEGLAMGDASREAGLNDARRALKQLQERELTPISA